MAGKLGTFAKSALLKDATPGLANAFTGKTINQGWMAGALAAGTALTAGAILGDGTGTRVDGNDAATFNRPGNLDLNQRIKTTAPAPMAQGSAPSIMAGGRQAPGAADNLGATGDMVFGMHNKRHG